MKAIALWNSKKNSVYSFSTIKLQGFVMFTQHKAEDPVKVTIFLEGLPEGIHGIHIHEKSMEEVKDIDTQNCCELLGGHFNVGEKWSPTEPNGTRHGEHNGDLCLNITSINGQTAYSFYDQKISLYTDDERCVLNRSVVIHENEDDEGKGLYVEEEKNVQSLITGNAGGRLACAEIRILHDPNF